LSLARWEACMGHTNQGQWVTGSMGDNRLVVQLFAQFPVFFSRR
jgi:hypothetical protein